MIIKMHTLLTRRIVAFPLLCILGILAVLISFFGTQSVVPDGPIDWTDRDKVTITFGEDGFEPDTIHVSGGTEVTFMSTRNGQFWPASDLHPSHSIYPDFDPRRPLGEDESWSFVFTNQGQWRYHDHLSPLNRGLIKVIPASATEDSLCGGHSSSEKKTCWNTLLSNAMDRGGLNAALDELKSLRLADVDFASSCHLFTHDIGLKSYLRYKDKPPISNKVGYCNDGFWHGYMEGFLREKGRAKEAAHFCTSIPRTFSGVYPLAEKQCIHGIGHGLAEYILGSREDLWSNMDAIAKMISEECDRVFVARGDRFRCIAGAYEIISNWMMLQLEGYKGVFSEDDPFKLCQIGVNEWAREACVWEFSKAIRVFTKGEPYRAFSILRHAIESGMESYAELMVKSVATRIGANRPALRDKELVEYCRSLPRDLQGSCIVGVGMGLFYSGIPDNSMLRAARFCLSAALDSRERPACASALYGTVSISYEESRVGELCQILADVTPSLWYKCFSPTYSRKVQ